MPNNRKPKQRKIIEGTFRKDRNPVNEPEPEQIEEAPRPPAYLNRFSKKYWKRIVQELVDTGVLTTIDLEVLELCCQAYGEYRETYEAIYKPIDPETGKKRKRTIAEYCRGRNSQTMPELTTMKSSREAWIKLSRELGLTPVARNKIDLKEKSVELDPLEKMFRESRAK